MLYLRQKWKTAIIVVKSGRTDILSTRYYRKPLNKGITLDYNSHHQLSTKQAVANNYYKTASEVSSGTEELQHSEGIVNKVLHQNGYPKPVRSKIPNASPVNQQGINGKLRH